AAIRVLLELSKVLLKQPPVANVPRRESAGDRGSKTMPTEMPERRRPATSYWRATVCPLDQAPGSGADRHALFLEHLLQLTGLEHLADDVAAADELAVDVKLGDRRPVRELLDAL